MSRKRPLQLRELRIEASRLAVAPAGLSFHLSNEVTGGAGVIYRWTAHHVREIFVAVLPRGYVLDGSSVLQLTCGPRGSEPQYRQILGSSEFYIDDFDFLAYAAPPQERQEILLGMIEAALRRIAALGGRSDKAIVAASEEVREINFRLTLPVLKLTKGIPGTRCTVQVLRHLSPEQGEVWTMIVLRRGIGLLKEVPIGPKPNYLDGRGLYQQASIENGKYVLRHRLGHVHFTYDLAQLGLDDERQPKRVAPRGIFDQ